MFQFPACPPVRLWIHLTVTGSSPAGFPHSEICVSKPTCGYTQLIAACRVLLRRMVPGHPPCALCSLIFSSLDPETNCFSYLYVSVVATGLIESLIFLVVQLSRCILRTSLYGVGRNGLEPSTSRLSGGCSNQLS